MSYGLLLQGAQNRLAQVDQDGEDAKNLRAEIAIQEVETQRLRIAAERGSNVSSIRGSTRGSLGSRTVASLRSLEHHHEKAETDMEQVTKQLQALLGDKTTGFDDEESTTSRSKTKRHLQLMSALAARLLKAQEGTQTPSHKPVGTPSSGGDAAGDKPAESVT